MISRPVWARAMRMASMVASVPLSTKRTISAQGTIEVINSAHRTS